MRNLKTLSLLLAIVMSVVLCFSACGGNADTDTTTKAPSEATTLYKDTMIPFEDIVSGKRIVILQNTLHYISGMDGFYTTETQPKAEEITYGGAATEAYKMTYAIDFLLNKPEADLKVTDTEGKTVDVKASDFAGMYVIIDFSSGEAPTIYNPTTKTEIKNFAVAVTAEGEAIYSIIADSTHNCAKILETCGWDTAPTYRYVAVDQFYIPVGESDNKVGELRGTLSGSINGSFPELTIASGKINDVVYLEEIVKQ